MPIRSKNCDQEQLFGLQIINVDMGGSGSDMLRTNVSVPAKCTLRKIIVDSNSANGNADFGYIAVHDGSGYVKMKIPSNDKLAPNDRPQQSLVVFTGAYDEGDALTIDFDCPKEDVSIHETIYVSVLKMAGTNNTGRTLRVRTDGSTDFDVTYTSGGSQNATDYLTSAAAALNANEPFTVAGYQANAVTLNGTTEAHLVVHRKNQAITGGGCVFDPGSWDATATDIDGASDAATLIMFGAALIGRICQDDGFQANVSPRDCHDLATPAGAVTIKPINRNTPFTMTVSATTAGDGSVIDQQYVRIIDDTSGIAVGTKVVAVPAAGYHELSDESQVQLWYISGSGSQAVDLSAQLLLGPPVTNGLEPEGGRHAEISFGELKEY
tara:strand:+ start:1056 stop:2198 length:1143 start_codon:yes stop_codon:yes gene_type:complete